MEKLTAVDFESIISRFGFLALGILLLFIPYTIFDYVGYSGPLYIVLEFLMALVGFLFILFSTMSSGRIRVSKRYLQYIMISTLLLISILIVIIGMSVKTIYTDELAIEVLSSKRLLDGLNPYGFHFGISALKAYGVSLSALTPTINGSYISTLQYPDLMILLLIPFVVFHVNPDALLFLFTVILIFIIAYEFISKELTFMVPLAVAIVFFNINLLFFSYEGITDIVWVVFLTLSLTFLQKKYVPGIFLGLSIAAKQLPVFIIPFLLIYVYKKYGIHKVLQVILFTVATFTLVNLPFIIQNPAIFISAVVAPENTPILGIGFGLSQVYFSGYLPFADREFFTVLMLSVWAFLVILYLYKFDSLKYALTVFPIAIVMFNFRLLENYIMYWPIITLATFPYIFKEKTEVKNLKQSVPIFTGFRKRFRKHILRNADLKKVYRISMVILLLIVISMPIYAFIQNDRVYDEKIVIKSATLSGINEYGFANSMMINVSYGKDVTNTSFNFRILEDGFLNNPNGLFWNESMQENNITCGFTVYHLYTNDSANFLIANNSYIIIAYNQYVETWYHITVGHSLLI